MNALSAGVSAFRDEFMLARPGSVADPVDEWGTWEARRARYELYWRFYQNDAYRNINKLSNGYKSLSGLYRHTRGCYNPTARLVEFHVTHILGGVLDPRAGDGKEVSTAIPIDTEDTAIREAIARLWMDSKWATERDVLTRWGTVCGDVFLRVCDDPEAGRVTLEASHPGGYQWINRNGRGEIIGYVYREWRYDPRQAGQLLAARSVATAARRVEYCETAELRGETVVYKTYLDGLPADWGNGAEWTVDYGFIPLYWIQHIDARLGWGLSEIEIGRAKFDEVNDLGSKLHDHIRKIVEGAWLFAGVNPPKANPLIPATSPTETNRQPARQETPALYSDNSSARPWSLVGDLDIPSVSAEIRQQLDSLEDDYPELRFERLRTGGTISGEAIRIARQPAAARVDARRPAYDQALLQATRAALAIGGHRGYPAYAGFNLEDYQGDRLAELRIGQRPVFAIDPMDRLAEKQARFVALKTATDAGLPLEVAMADLGYSEADVAEVKTLKDAARAEMMAALPAPGANPNPPNNNPGKVPAVSPGPGKQG